MKEKDIAKMLFSVSTDYLVGNLDIEVLKMQVKFANDILNPEKPN